MARSKDIDVSTEGISSTRSSAYDTFDEALRANLSQMTISIEALNATWEGPNHQNFVSTYEEHKDDLDAFHDALSAYLRAWSEAFREYNNCESDVAQHIN